jgi:hypothetical protein
MLRFNVIMTPIPRTSLARAALDASSRGAGPLVAEKLPIMGRACYNG